VLCIAWNYGGRDELISAIQQMIRDGVKAEAINDDLVSQYLFTRVSPTRI
jgi:undecaprenyl diphosphate synthase